MSSSQISFQRLQTRTSTLASSFGIKEHKLYFPTKVTMALKQEEKKAGLTGRLSQNPEGPVELAADKVLQVMYLIKPPLVWEQAWG